MVLYMIYWKRRDRESRFLRHIQENIRQRLGADNVRRTEVHPWAVRLKEQ